MTPLFRANLTDLFDLQPNVLELVVSHVHGSQLFAVLIGRPIHAEIYLLISSWENWAYSSVLMTLHARA